VVVLEVFGRIAEIDGRLNVFMVWRGEREGTQLQLVAGGQQPGPAQLRSEALFWLGRRQKRAPNGHENQRGEAKQGPSLPLALPPSERADQKNQENKQRENRPTNGTRPAPEARRLPCSCVLPLPLFLAPENHKKKSKKRQKKKALGQPKATRPVLHGEQLI
jgi:hypothetical protein